jgi:hypothetical protein
MQPTNVKRFYTPQFSYMSSVAVRRIAWALDVTMVEAVQHVFAYLPQLLDNHKICLSCKDNTKCVACIFSGSGMPITKLPILIN